MLPIDRTAKASLDANLVNGITSDAPAIKANNDVLYNTSDELNQKVNTLVGAGSLTPVPPYLLYDFLSVQAVINGNMEIAQRGTSFTIATAASAYTVDRIKSINSGSGVNATASQVAVSDLDGTSFGLQFVHAALPTAQGQLSHVYTLEAKDSYKLAGKKQTITVKVKGVAGMDKVTVNARYKTTESAISNASTLIGSGVTSAINNAGWTTVQITVTLPDRATLTSNGVVGIEIVASKSTAEASGDGFIIAQLMMNTGDTALPFQPLSFVEELALCQRYFEKSYDYGVIAGSSGSAANKGLYMTTVLGVSSANGSRWLLGKHPRFLVEKRTAPTIGLYNAAGTKDTWFVGGGERLSGTSAFSKEFWINNNTGAAVTPTAGEAYGHWVADAEL